MKIILFLFISFALVSCDPSSIKWTHLKFQKLPNTEIFYKINGQEDEYKILLILLNHDQALSKDDKSFNSQVISNFVNCNEGKWVTTSITLYSDHMGTGSKIQDDVIPKPYEFKKFLPIVGDSMMDKITDDICVPKSIGSKVLSLFN